MFMEQKAYDTWPSYQKWTCSEHQRPENMNVKPSPLKHQSAQLPSWML